MASKKTKPAPVLRTLVLRAVEIIGDERRAMVDSFKNPVTGKVEFNAGDVEAGARRDYNRMMRWLKDARVELVRKR